MVRVCDPGCPVYFTKAAQTMCQSFLGEAKLGLCPNDPRMFHLVPAMAMSGDGE